MRRKGYIHLIRDVNKYFIIYAENFICIISHGAELMYILILRYVDIYLLEFALHLLHKVGGVCVCVVYVDGRNLYNTRHARFIPKFRDAIVTFSSRNH